MYIKVNEVKIEVSDAYTSGQNQVAFVIKDMSADEVTGALSGISSFELFNDDDSIQKTYGNMALVSVSNVPDDVEGEVKIEVVVTFRQKSELEVRVEAIESSQMDQDDAIAELAVMIAE